MTTYKPSVIQSTPVPEAPPAPAPASFVPSRIPPSSIAAPISRPKFVPSALPETAAPPAVPTPEATPEKPKTTPATPSVLPGTRQTLSQITLADLESRFPGESGEVLQRVRGLLAGISFSNESSSFWLAFGVRAQDDLGAEVKHRLALVGGPEVRSVSQHMARLHALLKDVVDALDGGLFKKPAQKVWADSQGEVQQLEALLRQGAGAVGLLIDNLNRLTASSHEVGVELAVCARVLDYSLDKVPEGVNAVVLGRATSVATSMAMRLEHVAQTALQVQQLQAMAEIVQNGILVKLPTLYSSLASLPAKPTETQRFLAVEKINDLSQLLTR